MGNAMRVFRLARLAAAALTVAGCMDRLDHIGTAPSMSPMDNPTNDPTYQTVPMPMPPAMPTEQQAASLWQPGARAFFKDQRAAKVGDILTVVINLDESAQLNNTTSRSRNGSENASVESVLGLQELALPILSDALSVNAVKLNSEGSSEGDGAVNRAEKIEVQVAAIITDQLPNGNFVIAGRQQMRVNYELRELTVQGMIRPEDVTSANTISYDKIAEARISYGGRGQITDVQQPRYGQQILDIILPF